jgi:membrane fusion protein
MALFREEAIESRRARFYGSVMINQPISFSVMTGVAVLVLVLTFTFLATASFSRKESVLGWITPENGMSQIYAVKEGVARGVEVHVGQHVDANQDLAILSTDVSGPEGQLAPQQRALTEGRIGELEGQIIASGDNEKMEALRLAERSRALRTEVAHLQSQREFIAKQLAIARRELSDIVPLTERGFVSRLDKDKREEFVNAQEQTLAQINQQIDAKISEASDTDAQARQIPDRTRVELSQLRGQKSALEQNLAELTITDRQVLRSPVKGQVAAINVHAGDTASAGAPLIIIAPDGSHMEAELFVPTKAAGFIAPGQSVKLMVDAFPNERFGEVDGVIGTVSHAPMNLNQQGIPIDIKEAAYRVTVKLSSDHIMAYGKPQYLQPGMTLKASVVIAKQTFLQWFLDPLISSGKNMS